MKKIVAESGVGLDGDFGLPYRLFQDDGGRIIFEYHHMGSEGLVYMEGRFTLKEYRRALKELEETGQCKLDEVRSLRMKRGDDGKINFSFSVCGRAVFVDAANLDIEKIKI